MKTFYICLMFVFFSVYAFSQNSKQKNKTVRDSVAKTLSKIDFNTSKVYYEVDSIILFKQSLNNKFEKKNDSIISIYAGMNCFWNYCEELSWEINTANWTRSYHINDSYSRGRVYFRDYMMKNASREEGIEYLIQKN